MIHTQTKSVELTEIIFLLVTACFWILVFFTIRRFFPRFFNALRFWDFRYLPIHVIVLLILYMLPYLIVFYS